MMIREEMLEEALRRVFLYLSTSSNPADGWFADVAKAALAWPTTFRPEPLKPTSNSKEIP